MPNREELKLPHLFAWRVERGLTQTALADKASVTRGTVARAEAGDSMSVKTVHALAKALDITPHQLLKTTPADDLGKLAGAA